MRVELLILAIYLSFVAHCSARCCSDSPSKFVMPDFVVVLTKQHETGFTCTFNFYSNTETFKSSDNIANATPIGRYAYTNIFSFHILSHLIHGFTVSPNKETKSKSNAQAFKATINRYF